MTPTENPTKGLAKMFLGSIVIGAIFLAGRLAGSGPLWLIFIGAMGMAVVALVLLVGSALAE